MRSSDGAIISHAHRLKLNKRLATQTFELVRARVEKTIFIDDPENVSSQYVEYNIIIDGGPRDGALYKNVINLTDLGGFNNYSETVLSEHTDSSVSRPTNRKLPYNRTTNANYVVVLFLYGYDENPVIVGSWPHPRKKGATKSDGTHMRGEFNGIAWNITKNGELLIKSLGGPRDKKGQLTNDARGETSVTFDKDGKILIDRGGDSTVEITSEEVKITRGDNSIVTITDSSITLKQGGNRVKVSDLFVDIGGTSDLIPLDGVVTGQSIDPFIGVTHLDFSSKVRAKK